MMVVVAGSTTTVVPMGRIFGGASDRSWEEGGGRERERETEGEGKKIVDGVSYSVSQESEQNRMGGFVDI